jgi:uncharacterized protein YgbK (DUF1537 family)
MAPRFCVIADDLTGALDTGVVFRKNGFLTAVSSHFLPDTRTGPRSPEVLVVNTETRHLTPEQAYTVVSSLAAAMVKLSPDTIVYKKIDSTLRGNIGPELKALNDAFPGKLLVTAPALPGQGRTCREGSVYLYGKPLHETEFAQDPLNPIHTSYVPDLFLRGREPNVAVLSPGELERVLSEEVDSGNPGEFAYAVVDGETEEDLRQTARVCLKYPSRVIPAGSAGLAAWLSSLCGESSGSTFSTKTSPTLPVGPALVVNGSLNPAALEQIRNAIQEGARDLAVGGREAACLLEIQGKPGNAPGDDSDRISALVHSIGASLAKGDPVCIRTILDRGQLGEWLDDFYSTGGQGLPMHTALPRALGRLVAKVLESIKPALLVVLGGDTLSGVLEAFGSGILYPEAELEPGTVASRMSIPGGNITLVSKAGGFGDPGLLVRLLETES